MFSRDFKKDFELLISQKTPFSFTRYADGEYAVINGESIDGYDWNMRPSYLEAKKRINDGINILRTHNSTRNFIGISCPCCDPPKNQFYRNFFNDFYINNQITYSNLFVNGNYEDTIKWLYSLPVVPHLLMNDKAKAHAQNGIYATASYFPNNILEDLNKVKEQEENVIFMAKENDNTLFLVALGPYSEIIIPELVKANPNNYYIDIGSVVDPWMHGSTREYHKKYSEFRSRICTNV